MTIRFGYKASAEQFGPRQLVELAGLAEEHGLDSVFVSDHFQPWRHHGGHAPAALSWLGAAGQRTSRVLLGTSVLTPTFRYHPAVIAQSFATLACLFPGRVVLGVGSGEAMNEVGATGITAWPPFKERSARLREAVRMIRALWAGERVSVDGEHYRVEQATIYDRPEQPIPIYVAAGGPVMARYAGRAGDGFICTSGKGMPLYQEKLLPAVAEGLAQRTLDGAGSDPAGPDPATSDHARSDPASFDRTIEIKLSFDTDLHLALENTRFWAPLSLPADQKAELEDPVALERAADALPIVEVARRWIVTDDPEEAVAQIRPYLDAGFTHLVFHGPGHDQPRFLDQFAELVLPRLRQLAPAGA